jgi:dTDP-4-dehydrorhamnose 3,5-epimerase-like enzyme
MFFVQGRVEMILRDVREGFRSRIMHFFIDGDNHRGPNNVAVVIPPGVAHAVRVEGSEDAIMVYGTSTNFDRRSKAGLRATWNRHCCPKAGGVFWRNR